MTTDPAWSASPCPKTSDGSATPDEPVRGHLEDAELVRRAEPVLGCPQDAMLAIAVALELEDAVDQVLEDARPGDGAVLRDVTDEEDGDCPPPWRPAGGGRSLREPAPPSREQSRCPARRASGSSRSRRRSAARARWSRRRGRDSSRPRSRLPPAPPSRSARSFTWAADSSPVTSATFLALLIARRAMSSSVDFPIPGSPLTRTSEAGTSPPPEHPIELGNAGRKPVGLGRLDLVESNERLRDGGRGRAAPLLGALLEKRSPRAAAGATPEPASPVA